MHKSTSGIMLIQNMYHMYGQTVKEPSLLVTKNPVIHSIAHKKYKHSALYLNTD